MIFLIILSALISGSEVAYFSLSPGDIKQLRKKKNDLTRKVFNLLDKPEKLLATILISNNLVNVGIVIVSNFFTNLIFDFKDAPVFEYVFKIGVITFILLLFGEILPKIYASRHNYTFSMFMATPLSILMVFFSPLSALLINSTSVIKRKIKSKSNISIDELSDALELSDDEELKEDEKILKGIVNFGNITANQIMKPRVDVVSVDIKTGFKELLKIIIETGYSRIPVYNKTFDDIKGILYSKDLLPHIHKTNFRWQSLVRPPYYVPETKKINDLLTEFQAKKIHMAIVIDEYGGASGIITLEDVLEEIVGEITDEHDEDDTHFNKISDNIFEFDAKTLLQDFYKIMEISDDYFSEVKGDADTLAGLILEIKGEIPDKNDVVDYKNFKFTIKEVDNRRIKTIVCEIKEHVDSLT
jgi:gliding motility-associated protein GldE